MMWAIEGKSKLYSEALTYCVILYSYLLGPSVLYFAGIIFTNMSDGSKWLFLR